MPKYQLKTPVRTISEEKRLKEDMEKQKLMEIERDDLSPPELVILEVNPFTLTVKIIPD